MIANNTTEFVPTAPNKMKITRSFAAPVANVWKAWTQPALLDLWWAPRPWKTVTKRMDFREGGTWLYSMNGPEGEVHFCRNDYKTIQPNTGFSSVDAFCDEEGNINTDFPRTDWAVTFTEAGSETRATIELTFATEADLEKIAELGFKEGFTAALENLDELIEKKTF